MIDLKFLRENPETVKQNIRNKFQDSKLPLVDEVIEFDARARKTQQEADALRAQRKKLSKQIGALMGQGKKEEAEAVKAQVNAGAERLAELEKLEDQMERARGCTVRVIGHVYPGVSVEIDDLEVHVKEEQISLEFIRQMDKIVMCAL